MQVFLIGFMGAGKSTIGAQLANRLKIPFVDMDRAIEAQEYKSIGEIFEEKGEIYFRELELNWIHGLNKEEGVFSLGGGTPCQEGIMDYLRKKGITVYLRVSENTIVERLLNSEENRPLIKAVKNDRAALAHFVKEKLNEREVFYRKAKIIIDPAIIDLTIIDPEKIDLLKDLIKIASIYHQPD